MNIFAKFKGALGLKPDKPERVDPTFRSPMRRVSKKRAAHRASQAGQDDLAYMQAVRELPCIICQEWGLKQKSRTQAHHPIHGRYGNLKVSDRMVIPLCEGHHQGDFDTSKIAIHRAPDDWRLLYGNDYDWTAKIRDMIGETP